MKKNINVGTYIELGKKWRGDNLVMLTKSFATLHIETTSEELASKLENFQKDGEQLPVNSLLKVVMGEHSIQTFGDENDRRGHWVCYKLNEAVQNGTASVSFGRLPL